MSKAPRKRFTEVALNIYSAEPVVTTPAYLGMVGQQPAETRQQLKNCNIYVIGRRPRIAFDPATLRINEDRKLAGTLVVAGPQGGQTASFVGRERLAAEFLSVSTDYPFTKVDAHGEAGASWGLPNFWLLPDLDVDIDGLQDIEVAYVGQAFGTAGERTAVERLTSHSTLQKILAETAANEPHKEVLLLLYSFDFHRFFFTMDGRDKAQIDGDDDRKHWQQAMAADFKRGMRISLAEAALIRHFEPHYNKVFKTGFPNQRLRILEKMYSLDFAALVVEASVEEVGLRLYSAKQTPKFHHVARFDLHDPKDRKTFFFGAV